VESMRERFTRVTSDALDSDERLALVLADIGVDGFEATGAARRHPARVINVGIREQLMIGVAAGLAQEGLRPVAHSYAPFLVERPFEQIKLDLGHQDAGAILVSTGASYDAAPEGRTHQAPGDVALLATVPGFAIHVPGHPDEAAQVLRREFARDGRAYIRLSGESNAEARPVEQLTIVRTAGPGAPFVLAVGPALDEVLVATADLPVAVAYAGVSSARAARSPRPAARRTARTRARPRRARSRRARRCGARPRAAAASTA